MDSMCSFAVYDRIFAERLLNVSIISTRIEERVIQIITHLGGTMREVILYIAMSLDGYIADKNGGVDWLGGQDANDQSMGSYEDFIKEIDTVIMGYRTYHQIVTELSPDQWVYQGMKTYVLTHHPLESTNEIVFTDQTVKNLIANLKSQNGKHLWICGGADVVNQCIQNNLIDRYHITVMPTLLGDGIKLFDKQRMETKLKLVRSQSYNGMMDLVYERRDGENNG